jgi:hypothetical protein
MKVYIILDESNDLGVGSFVEKVFSSKEKAVDYVYADFMKHPYYAGKSKQDLVKEIESGIHEAEVE